METRYLPHRVARVDGSTRQYSSLPAAVTAVARQPDLGVLRIAPVFCARSSHLTGHCADGGGVQAHSAGGLYPFVLFFREGGAGTLRYCVMGPGIEGELRFATYLEAVKAAERCKAVADNDDAWAFELEALRYVAGQKQVAMTAAATALAEHDDGGRWFAMSKERRVASLLSLGKTRNELKLPMTQRPAFAALAAAVR